MRRHSRLDAPVEGIAQWAAMRLVAPLSLCFAIASTWSCADRASSDAGDDAEASGDTDGDSATEEDSSPNASSAGTDSGGDAGDGSGKESGEESGESGSEGADSDSSNVDSTGSGTGQDAPTWHEHIRPLLERACTRCHREGGVGPFDFRDRAVVESLGTLMADVIDAGEMPPPVSDPGCRDYDGSDRLVAPSGAAEMLRSWIEGGALEGDPADTPDLPPEIESDLVDPDLVLRFRTPHVPQFGGALGNDNEYACLVLEDSGRDEPFFITRMAPVVDHPQVVHHIVLHKLPRSQVPEGQDQLDGIRCAGLGAPEQRRSSSMLSAWAPGMLPIEFPDDMGLRVDPDQVLVVQMHYFRSGTDADDMPDHSGYAFGIADSRRHEISVETMGPDRFTIPAHAQAHVVSGTEPVAADTLYLGAFPHMHVLGKGYEVNLRGQGGAADTCLARSDGYDFDNQLTFMYREPFLVPQATQLEIDCIYDNSTNNPDLIHNPPIDTRFGLKTDDEMCFSFNLVVYGYDGG